MIYYIVFGISVFSLYYSDRQTVRDYSGKIFNKKNVFMLFSIIPLILLATFRDVSIGTDVKVYIAPTFDLACKAGSYSEFMRTQPYEFLYATINYLVAQISHNIQWLFCVLEIMMLLPTYYFICYHKKQRISVAISLFSFCFLYYAYTYNTVRQYMAMACIMIAYTFMDKRSYLKSYILILTAFGFHTSAFVCVVFPILHWLITNKKAHMYNKYLIISLVVAVYLIALNYAFFFRLIGTYLPLYLKDICLIITCLVTLWIFHMPVWRYPYWRFLSVCLSISRVDPMMIYGFFSFVLCHFPEILSLSMQYLSKGFSGIYKCII